MWSKARKDFEEAFVASRWLTETCLLGLFWMIVLPFYMGSDFLMDEEAGNSVRDVINTCTKPSVDDLTRHLTTVIFINLLFNVSVRFGNLRPRSYHIISAVTGYLVVHTNSYPRNILLILGFIIGAWFLLKHIQYVMTTSNEIVRPVYTISIALVSALISGELFFPDRQNWQECRGVIMIMAMKVISLSTEDYYLVRVNVYEFFGYLLCPATVLFGPWIKIQEYRLYKTSHSKLNWKWMVRIVQIFTCAMICMVISNCLNQTLVVENSDSLCKWGEAFRNALAFHANNYYICYMAELTMLTAGFNYIHGNPSEEWQYSICRPVGVELPRSISTALRNWNIPMHHFLKTYVYSPHLHAGKIYAAVLTFFVSLLLHGFDRRMTVILLSLGILSLSQQVIQDKLAAVLSACCKVTTCRRNCDHRYGAYHPITLLVNGVNLILNKMHLTYLGYVMEEKFRSSSWRDLYCVWDQDLGLLSHHVILVWCTVMLFIVK